MAPNKRASGHYDVDNDSVFQPIVKKNEENSTKANVDGKLSEIKQENDLIFSPKAQSDFEQRIIDTNAGNLGIICKTMLCFDAWLEI